MSEGMQWQIAMAWAARVCRLLLWQLATALLARMYSGAVCQWGVDTPATVLELLDANNIWWPLACERRMYI